MNTALLLARKRFGMPDYSSKASFRTHLNYIKCLEKLLSVCTLSVTRSGTFTKRTSDIQRFKKLYLVTLKSIRKDIELAREDPAFSIIAAPWFSVKCYYALYYLESILIHLTDGSSHGFTKAGHGGVRKRIMALVNSGNFSFSLPEINKVNDLAQIDRLPPIKSGQNTRIDYWDKPECVGSILKKLMEYKLHDAKLAQKWDLRTKKHQFAKKAYIAGESLMVLDSFYWYRIKANYRDLDYIDFENGITEEEVLGYMESYFNAFNHYRVQLVKNINKLS